MTHHGRPGGRLLELALLFGVIGLTGFMIYVGLRAGATAVVWVAESIGHVHGRGAAGLMLMIFGLGFSLCVVPVLLLWPAFLKFYKYDPKTLKPITEQKERT